MVNHVILISLLVLLILDFNPNNDFSFFFLQWKLHKVSGDDKAILTDAIANSFFCIGHKKNIFLADYNRNNHFRHVKKTFFFTGNEIESNFNSGIFLNIFN